MHLKEIILDGFKSYARKTTITGFDSSFNAITGLNGTGKSNILDAICFVFGITKMDQVRVQNSTELIYKSGQAGITKASVTLFFDNSDSATAPTGYTNETEMIIARELSVGGRNKYWINGTLRKQGQVHDLFQSVGLNVNNPHFLIMQGTITRVMNKKPAEILAMLEEAAGTRMFETKKTQSLKTLENKQKKVLEIDDILERKLGPKLEGLQSQKQELTAMNQAKQIESRMKRKLTAFDYYTSITSAEQSNSNLQSLEQSIADVSQRLDQANTTKRELETKLKSATLDDDPKMKKKFAKAQERVSSLEKELALCKLREDEIIGDLNGFEQKLEDGHGRVPVITRSIQSLNEELSRLRALGQQKSEEIKTTSQSISTFEANKKSMVTGVSSSNGKTLSEQLIESQANMENIAGLIKTLQGKHANLDVTLASHDSAISDSDYAAAEELANQIQQLQSELDHLKNSINEPLVYDDVTFSSVEAVNLALEKVQRDLTQIKHDQAELQKNYQQKSAELSSFFFKTPSSAKVSPQSVKGPVVRLFEITDPSFTTPLEVVGGRFFNNIVVDSDETASVLLRSNLRHATTFLPLNKVRGHAVSQEDRDYVARVTKNTGRFAIDCVAFHSNYTGIMQHVFKRTVVCEKSYARQLAYSTDKKFFTVTPEGDVYDPNGTLSGGSVQKKGSILMRFSNVRQMEIKLGEFSAQFQHLSEKHRNLAMVKETCESKSKMISQQSNELERLKTRIDSNPSVTALDQLSTEIDTQQRLLSVEKTRAAQLQNSVSQGKDGVNLELKRIEKNLTNLKKKINDLEVVQSELIIKSQRLESEVKSLNRELDEIHEFIENGAVNRSELQGKLQNLRDDVILLNDQHQEALAVLEQLHDLHGGSKLIDSLRESITTIRKNISSLSQQHTALKDQYNSFTSELSSCSARAKALLRDQPWLKDVDFESPHCEFRFEDIAADKLAYEKARQELEQKKKMGLNESDFTSLDKHEKDVSDLRSRRQQLEADKERIKTTIEALDHKKISKINDAFERVARDVSQIFSTLLPGANAKVQDQRDNEGTLIGLSLSVAFGGIWKESLGELSGGQKSLLALSLILALLKYKPAPIYILDEIDSALDLSHTTNIGKVIRNDFGDCQFLIVSLKEGMFNNANVIFNTSFVDGSSQVRRTIGRGR
ncbi:hypothetical protein GEMRC1_013382 [Eukaryota sp. GEM-RC1]